MEGKMGNFENPQGHWEHKGGYSIELLPNTPTDGLPPGIEESKTPTDHIILKVPEGRMHQSMGGIQLYSKEEPFHIGYRYLVHIKKEDGSLLWQNNRI